MASGFFNSTTSGSSVVFGQATTGLDLNNDGLADVVYGADQSGLGSGQVTVLYGDAGGFDASVDLATLSAAEGFTLSGGAIDDEFGWALGQAENLLGQGGDALVIGARGAGTVSVVFSDTTQVGLTITGLTPYANQISVTGVGDFNGDGIGDFAIGAPDTDSGAGAVYIVFGAAALAGTLDVSDLDGTNGFKLTGFEFNDEAGFSISAIGPDANGLGGFIVGAPGDDDDGTSAGTVYVVRGTTDAIAATENISTTTAFTVSEFTGAAAGDETGRSVSGGFDVNGDGAADLLIGADLADPNGASSGVAYVVFDAESLGATTDLAALDGSDGFAIEGLSAGDQLGASAQFLGDVSGDGIADIGVLTASGDVYIVFGDTANTGGAVDLSALDGTNGIALTGLFSQTPSNVFLAALGDINGDASGAIADLNITAEFSDGSAPVSFTVLGGLDNLAALDAADGSVDGEIAFDQISTAVEFSETNPTIIRSGDTTGSITEDTATTTGAIGITDTTGLTSPSFAGRMAAGTLGVFAINAAGDLWTYTVNDNADLQYLDAGDVIYDSASVVASNGSQQEITIEISGLNDVAVASGDLTLGVSEDFARTVGSITVTDVDGDDSPTLAGARAEGTYGYIEVASDGTYTYFLTSADIETLGAGATAADSITLTADDGSTHTVTIAFSGSAEGTNLSFDATDNAIYTSFGDDMIFALGGNDTIDAGAGNDVIDAGSGNDVVTDALGDDQIDLGAGDDRATLLTGNNSVDGGDGSDFIQTGYRDDFIQGGSGNDIIAADEGALFVFGNNTIEGGTGDDIMMGGEGIDTYVFNPNDGSDEIGMFDPSAVVQSATGFSTATTGADFALGLDKIRLVGFSTIDDTNVLAAITSGTGGAEFSAEGTTIFLKGILVSNLTVDDFEFV